MSQQFPTHKQFIEQTRARLRTEYPEAAKQERMLLEDCIAMNSDTGAWLRHLGDLIAKGVKPEVPVLDTLTQDQLNSLKGIYAPREALDWYIPAEHRTNRTLEPRSKRFTPEKLFAYAVQFSKEHEDAGNGSKYPTFRQAAEHFKVTVKAIARACEEWQGDGYMSACVGFRCGERGIYSIESKKDYLVEAYR